MTQPKLAAAVQISLRTLQYIEEGESTSPATLNAIATVLGVSYERLVLTQRVVILPGNIRNLPPSEPRQSLDKIEKAAGLTDGMKEMDRRSGSIKVTVNISLEDAIKLDIAYASGRLKPFGVLGVETPSGEKPWRRHALRKWVSLACSTLGLLFSLSAFLPVWRVPFFAAGVALGVTGGALGYRRRYLLLVAGLAVAANVAGWGRHAVARRLETGNSAAGATLIVLVTDEGNELATAWARAGSSTNAPAQSQEFTLRVDKDQVNGDEILKEFASLADGPDGELFRPGGKEADRYQECLKRIAASNSAGKLAKMETQFGNRLPAGQGPLILHAYGKVIYQGDVYNNYVGKIFCLLDTNPDKSTRVIFVPDITKPIPPNP